MPSEINWLLISISEDFKKLYIRNDLKGEYTVYIYRQFRFLQKENMGSESFYVVTQNYEQGWGTAGILQSTPPVSELQHRNWHLNLTHWGRDKMDGIFQMTFSNGFSWMKMY